MTRSQDNTVSHIVKGGDVKIEETKRGIKFSGWNFQQERFVHFGTVKGSTYEKQANRLYKFQAYALNQSEFGKLLETPAKYIRIDDPHSPGKFWISVEDFDRFKEPFHNAYYGPQWIVPVSKFDYIPGKAKRNAFTDNPPVPINNPFEAIENKQKQMSLFDR